MKKLLKIPCMRCEGKRYIEVEKYMVGVYQMPCPRCNADEVQCCPDKKPCFIHAERGDK
jgi:hypothetical protein